MCTFPNSSGSSHFSLNEGDEFNMEAMEKDKVEGNEEEEEDKCNNGKQRGRKLKRKANTLNTDSDNRNSDAMDVPMVKRRKNTKPNAHTPISVLAPTLNIVILTIAHGRRC